METHQHIRFYQITKKKDEVYFVIKKECVYISNGNSTTSLKN